VTAGRPAWFSQAMNPRSTRTSGRTGKRLLLCEHQFVAFTMTAATHKRQGLAHACMVSAMQSLRAAGESRVRLLVTEANVEAVALYQRLGFEFEA
jgi:GNAT superfamily N-acetyltransferase